MSRHRVWYSKVCACWFVNYIGEPLHGDFLTLPEAMDWLHDELVRTTPIEAP